MVTMGALKGSVSSAMMRTTFFFLMVVFAFGVDADAAEQKGGWFPCGDDIFDHQTLPDKAMDDPVGVTCETVDRDSDGYINKAEALCGFVLELKAGRAVSPFVESGTLVWSEGTEYALARYVGPYTESETLDSDVEESSSNFASWVTKWDTNGDKLWSVEECIAQGLNNPFVNEGKRAPVCTKECSSTEPCTDCECCGNWRRECGGTCACPGLSWMCKTSIEADFDFSASRDDCLAPSMIIWPKQDWPPPMGGLAGPIISSLVPNPYDYNLTYIGPSGLVYEIEEEPRITCLPPGCLATCDSQCFALAYADNVDYLDLSIAEMGWVRKAGASDLDSLFVVLITLVCFHILGCALCCRGICFPRARPLEVQAANEWDQNGASRDDGDRDKGNNSSLHQVMVGGVAFGEPQSAYGMFPVFIPSGQAFAVAQGPSQGDTTRPTQGGGQPTYGGWQPAQGEGQATPGGVEAGGEAQAEFPQQNVTELGQILPVAEPVTATTGGMGVECEEAAPPVYWQPATNLDKGNPESEDRPATKLDKAMAAGALIQEVVGKASNLASILITSSAGGLWAILLLFQVGLVYFYSRKEQYVPGCAYNDVHILRRGVKFGKRYKEVGFPWSLKMAMIGVFFSSNLFDIATTCFNIASISCFLGLGTVDIAQAGYFKVISTLLGAVLSFKSSSMGVAMAHVILNDLFMTCCTCCRPTRCWVAMYNRCWVAMYERS